VVDALRCATNVQAALAEWNGIEPTGSRVEFRIGSIFRDNGAATAGS
jgi:hypothetical protein